MTFDDWTTEAGKTALAKAHDAGLSSERNFYQGQAVVYLIASSNGKDNAKAARMLRQGLTLSGARGARFVAGLRSAVAAVEAVEDFVAADTAKAPTEPGWSGNA